MTVQTISRGVCFLLLAIAASTHAYAQQPALPDNVETRAVALWSDGTRLAGDLFYPKGLGPDDKRPAIVMSHGWGGVRSHLNRAYAPFFAAAGYVVLTFDYRGWGDSNSRLVLTGPMPAPDDEGKVTVEVQAIRQLVDPFDQTEDIINALSFIEGEPGVDAERIGLWGTSYSGGHVIWVAAHDPRVKAIVAQVGAQDSIGWIAAGAAYPGGLAAAHGEQIRRARGEIDPVPQGVNEVPGLRGTPFISRMAHYSPRSVAHLVRASVLILDAEKEELFDIRENGQRVSEIVKENAPAKYHVFPGVTHYEVYSKVRNEAIAMAIDWYDQHLKGSGSE